jgi:hypothetical protein
MMTDSAEGVKPRERPIHKRLDQHRTAEQRAALWAREQARIDAETPILTTAAREAGYEAAKAAALAITAAPHQRRAKDVLSEIMHLMMAMARLHQPSAPQHDKNPNEDRTLFDRYILMAMRAASELAPYQSPKAVIIKEERPIHPTDEYDLTALSDEQLLTLRQLLAAAKPVMIDVKKEPQ